jgi:hypothetical protein
MIVKILNLSSLLLTAFVLVSPPLALSGGVGCVSALRTERVLTTEFTLSSLRERCATLLSQYSRCEVINIEFVGTEGESLLYPDLLSDATFEWWRAWFGRVTKVPSPVARLLRVATSAIFEYRDPRQPRAIRELIAGQDPTLLTTSQGVCMLRGVSVDRRNGQLHFFVSTDATLSPEIGRSILDELSHLVKRRDIDVTIRNDSIFVSAGYPDPFQDRIDARMIQDFRRGMTLYCSSDNVQRPCVVF